MNANIAALLYIASGVLFILALRGLSSPVTSQAGNRNGMIGMAIAVGVTLATLWGDGKLDIITLGLIAGGVAIGSACAELPSLARNVRSIPEPAAPARTALQQRTAAGMRTAARTANTGTIQLDPEPKPVPSPTNGAAA